MGNLPKTPWIATTSDDKSTWWSIRDARGRLIGSAFGASYENHADVARVARLMAAAPDFFHAAITGAQLNLPDFLDWIAARLINFGDEPNVDFVMTLRERAKLFRAAIAKATGEK